MPHEWGFMTDFIPEWDNESAISTKKPLSR
jgi:hypothetical protein